MAKPEFGGGKGGGKGPNKGKSESGDTTSTAGAITGTASADTLFGTDGQDTILGFDGDDVLSGGTGFNTMDAGNGSDVYLVSGRGNTNHITDSGTDGATDTILATTSFTVIGLDNFDADSGVEIISGGGHGSVDIEGTSGNNVLDFSGTTLLGIDHINGQSGDDLIIGSESDDLIYGSYGNDTIVGGMGEDTLVGGSGADTFSLQSGDTGIDLIKDFDHSQGDQIDLTDHSSDPEVVGWEMEDRTPENGVDDPILSLLYANGAKMDIARFEGLSQDEMDDEAFTESILF